MPVTITQDSLDKLLALCRVDDVPKAANMSADDRAWCETHVRLFSRLAESYTGRAFMVKERTRDFTVACYSALVRVTAYGHPDSQVTSLWQTLGSVYDATTLSDPSSYVFDYETGIVEKRFGYWLEGKSALRVTWTGGIAATVEQVPEDIRGAAAMQVASWYQRRDQLNISSLSMGGESTTRFSEVDLLPLVKRVLDTYCY